MVWKVMHVKKGDLAVSWKAFMANSPKNLPPGVRAPIVVSKRGNARGAKGRRKVVA
jgi:hypothetical protein